MPPQNDPLWYIRATFCIIDVGEARHFKFGTNTVMLIVANSSQHMTWYDCRQWLYACNLRQLAILGSRHGCDTARDEGLSSLLQSLARKVLRYLSCALVIHREYDVAIRSNFARRTTIRLEIGIDKLPTFYTVNRKKHTKMFLSLSSTKPSRFW